MDAGFSDTGLRFLSAATWAVAPPFVRDHVVETTRQLVPALRRGALYN